MMKEAISLNQSNVGFDLLLWEIIVTKHVRQFYSPQMLPCRFLDEDGDITSFFVCWCFHNPQSQVISPSHSVSERTLGSISEASWCPSVSCIWYLRSSTHYLGPGERCCQKSIVKQTGCRRFYQALPLGHWDFSLWSNHWSCTFIITVSLLVLDEPWVRLHPFPGKFLSTALQFPLHSIGWKMQFQWVPHPGV